MRRIRRKRGLTALGAPFGWVGAKRKMFGQLKTFINDAPHSICVDVFGGSGSVIFAKEPEPFEVYNDADDRLADFFRVLTDDEKRERLKRLADATPCSRALFEDAKTRWIFSNDVVKRAFALFYVQTFSFGGTYFGSFSISTPSGRDRVRTYRTNVDALDAYAKRFRNVVIESLDWKEMIERYDADDALFYVDPPYLCSRKTFYRKDLAPVDHSELVAALARLKGRVVLSCYDDDVYAPLLNVGWKRETFATRTSVPGRRDGDRRTETIYLSPQFNADSIVRRLF